MTIKTLPGTINHEIRKMREACSDALVDALGLADDSMLRKWESQNKGLEPKFSQCIIMDATYKQHTGKEGRILALYSKLYQEMTPNCKPAPVNALAQDALKSARELIESAESLLTNQQEN